MEERELSLGAMNASVRQLHADLTQRRFHLPRDEVARGYFGPGTRQALMQFQRHSGLPLTGVADAPTTLALGIQFSASLVAEPTLPEDPPTPGQPVNDLCPWSGRPIGPDSLLIDRERVVGFCSPAHRDRFALAIQHFADQHGLPLGRKTCPWSGKRVRPNATLIHDGETVGFCSPAHRDQFAAALEHFGSSGGGGTMQMTTATDAMAPMEGVADTTYVPPLVDEQVAARFCQAVQSYADSQGLHDAAAAKLALLQLRLDVLRNLASFARLALIGYPQAFARLEDELRCLAADFPCEKPEPVDDADECCAGSSGQTVFLSVAVDLFAAATFLWKDDRPCRDRTILAIVRAIEEAVAFPASFAAEAATFVGAGNGDVSPGYAPLVIANATQRLLRCDDDWTPPVPADVRRRLEGLALAWIDADPVTAFFEAIEGPRVHRIVRWQTDMREARTPPRAGDTLSILVHEACELEKYGVMFTPRQPASDAIVIDAGFQVRVPPGARTGPVIVVPKKPDFACVSRLLATYQRRYPNEINASILLLARIDAWAYPLAYRRPCITVAPQPASVTASVFTATGPLASGQSIAVGQTVSIQYHVDPAGTDAGVTPTITVLGGSVSRTGRRDVLLFQASTPGTASVALAWGSTSISVPINVAASQAGQ